MTTAAQVIAVARSQVGYHETGTNHTKYWAELDPSMQGSPWCAGFLSWVFKHAGAPLPAIDKPYGAVSAVDIMSYAKHKGLWSTNGRYAPGDIIVYEGGGHTGLCVSDSGTVLRCIDGNWGDQVAEFNRSHGPQVSGAFQTSRLLSKVASALPVAHAAAASPAVKAAAPKISAQTTMIQRAVNITPDGIWGSITQIAAETVIQKRLGSVKYLQARVGVAQDGFWGPASEVARVNAVKKIQTAIGTPADGVWGSASQQKWSAAVVSNYKN